MAEEKVLENPTVTSGVPFNDTDNQPVIMENDTLTDAIKEFNFNDNDDFDIVIDTGTDKKN